MLHKAILLIEEALAELEEYTDDLDSDDTVYEEIDNCCYQIRDAYRDLKDLL